LSWVWVKVQIFVPFRKPLPLAKGKGFKGYG
jgi:hypothetical protein